MDIFALPRRVDDVRSAIVHAVEIAVLQHGGVSAGIALPGLVARERDFSGDGSMKRAARTVQRVNQEVVYEELTAITDVDWPGISSSERDAAGGGK